MTTLGLKNFSFTSKLILGLKNFKGVNNLKNVFVLELFYIFFEIMYGIADKFSNSRLNI